MSLRIAVLFLSLSFLFPKSVIAQSIPSNWHFISDTYLPDISPEMPDWFSLLLEEEVNIIELESAYAAYYEIHGWEDKRDGHEHNRYTKYFRMWKEAASPFIENDGTVKRLSTQELKQLRIEQAALANTAISPNAAMTLSPTSTWSFLGPTETIWRKEHNDAQPVAPWQANIYAFAIAPSNPSILYAAAETGGVYKTTDKGLNWTAFQDYNFGGAATAIAIHPTNPDIVLVGRNSDIFKTSDGGMNWSIVYTSSAISPESIAFNPSNPNNLLMATAGGLYESTNLGDSWSAVTAVPDRIYDIAYQPGNASTIFVLGRNDTTDKYTLYKTTNGGTTWSLSMGGWPNITESSGGRMTVTPANANSIYVVLLANEGQYILKSTDAAATWTVPATGGNGALDMNGGQGFYDLDIVASHQNADHLIVATTTAYRSTDGGVNWTAVGGYTGDFSIHPDIQEMRCIMDGANMDTWISTDGGINYSSDFFENTSNFEARIKGLDGCHFWGFSQGWNIDYIVGGRYHNGNTCLHENYPDGKALRMGGAEDVTGWALPGRDLHAAFRDISDVIVPNQIDQPAGGTFTVTKYPQYYYYGDAFSRMLTDMEDYMTMYVGEGNSFWKTTDGGVSWEATFTFPGKPYHFDISRANPDVIYCTTDAGLYRSADRGMSFTSISAPSGLTNWNIQNLRVQASSTDENTVWVLNQRSNNSSNNRVFKSVNGGNSWTNLSSGMTNGRKWTSIAHVAGSNGGIYIASDRGASGTYPSKVLYRDDNMSDWVDFSNNFPASINAVKLLPFYRDSKLRLGTNRGAWEVDLYDPNFAPIAFPFVDGKIKYCERDPFLFDSYSVLKGTGTYSWSFPGASTVSCTTCREPEVTYPGIGIYTATLTVSHDGMSNSRSIDVEVKGECTPETVPGYALSLAGGSSDYGISAKSLDLNTNTITMATWIKIQGTQPAYAGIVMCEAANTKSGLNFRDNNVLGWHWNGGGWWINSAHTVPTDQWTHVALTVTPTQLVVYMNGVPSIHNGSYAVDEFDTPVQIGAYASFSGRRVTGLFDETVIYDRALTQDEVRELMHLTKIPSNDASLVAYWQYNRESGEVTDRVGDNHVTMGGTASRVTSTAPVGGGTSKRLDVTTSGTYDFTGTNLALTFPTGASAYPNGELVATRIDLAPDQNPNPFPISSAYWVLHNHGTNSTFDELESIQLDAIGQISTEEQTTPNSLKLYKRESTDDGATWGSIQATATAVTAGTNGSATFGLSNGITSFSQFVVSREEAILPVDLLDFKVYLTNEKKAKLNWTTASEINTASFEIERSKDGALFEKIGEIAAQGNAQNRTDYSFLDENPIKGLSYYRLKIVEEDARFEYSPVRTIMMDGLAEKVILYPNPLPQGENINVRTNSSQQIEIKVFNSEGEEVYESIFVGDTILATEKLPRGTYNYEIKDKTWRTAGIFIVQ